MSDPERSQPVEDDLTKPPAAKVTTVNRRPLFMAGTLLLFAFLLGLNFTAKDPRPAGGSVQEPPASAPTTNERLAAFLREQEQRARERVAPRSTSDWSPPGPSADDAQAPLPDPGPRSAPESNRTGLPGTYNPEGLDAPAAAAPWAARPSYRPAPSTTNALIRYRANDPSAIEGSQPQESSDPVQAIRTQLARMITSASPAPAEPSNLPVVPGPLPEPGGAPMVDPGSNRPATLRLAPSTPTRGRFLFQGSLIPATLEADIVSDLPGTARAIVRQHVYDSLTGTIVLIPQGSKLLGEYSSAVAYGDSRLLLAWKRLILPDGTSYLLQDAPATDPAGAAGLPGEVNNHWGRLVGSALLLSAISAGTQLSQTPSRSDSRLSPTASEVAAAALGQELGSASTSLLRRELQVKPTIRVQAGTLFHVEATADLLFPER